VEALLRWLLITKAVGERWPRSVHAPLVDSKPFCKASSQSAPPHLKTASDEFADQVDGGLGDI
jgi:hypothetical protein